MWIRRHHGEYQPPKGDHSAAKGHNYDDFIVPFLPLVKTHEMLVESSKFGRTYESLIGLELTQPQSCQMQNTDSDGVHSSSVQIQSQVLTHKHVLSSSNERWNHDKSTKKMNTVPHKFSIVMSRPEQVSNEESYINIQYQQLMPALHVCVLKYGKLVFQIPPNCDELVFQNNLILPRMLVPFNWYFCSPQSISKNTHLQRNSKALQQVTYTCTLF